MRTETITLFNFSELPEKIQRRIWENGPDFSGDYSGDYEATLKAFENFFDISVYRYSVNDWNYDFRFITAGAGNEAPEGDPLRLARFVWNNYAECISKGKYYGTTKWTDGEYKHKYRYSNIKTEMDNCPLTGVCRDYDILQPVIDCLHYKAFYKTYRDLIDACLNRFFEAWRANIEYCSGFEYFAECIENGENEYTADGRLWTGGATA